MKRVFSSIVLIVLTLGFVGQVSAQVVPTIQIVKPLDRRNVPAKNAQVTVQITGIAPGAGYYWELWVDEEPIVGVTDGATTVTVSQFKPTGPHRLKAVLFDSQGKQLAVSESILVLAAPVQERTPQFNRERMAPIMAVFVVLVSVLIAGSVWFNRRSRASQVGQTEPHNT